MISDIKRIAHDTINNNGGNQDQQVRSRQDQADIATSELQITDIRTLEPNDPRAPLAEAIVRVERAAETVKKATEALEKPQVLTTNSHNTYNRYYFTPEQQPDIEPPPMAPTRPTRNKKPAVKGQNCNDQPKH